MSRRASLVVDFADADAANKTELGGKGAGLAAMTQSGLPVPPGFVITTSACRSYVESDRRIVDRLWVQVEEAIGLSCRAT